MDDDEDIFSMLDGIQQVTQGYANDHNQFEQHAGPYVNTQYDQHTRQWPRQAQTPQYHASTYSHQSSVSSAHHGFHQQQPQLQQRDMLPPQRVNQGNEDAGLFVSPESQRYTNVQRPHGGGGNFLSQYAYQSSSPVHQRASSPSFSAGQRRNEHVMPQPRITQVTPRQVDQDYGSFAKPDPPQQDFETTREPSMMPPPAQTQPRRAEVLSTHTLPDRFRSIFQYPNFNTMQSKCFSTVYRSNDNFVLSSPTGSGKTAIFELAICRVIGSFPAGQFKIIYQAPTKALCAERQRDWQQKFRAFQLECAELTGDTDPAQLRNVQSASIIITTPEKWDSITRKWKDHEKLMSMIKLFLIDEVHMLHDARGATLEAVVSRMKSVHSEVRFIALSATVPNSNDIATWLGRDHNHQNVSAREERFGEEYRPVLLQKHVIGYQHGGNDFSFESLLDARLPEIISKYSHRKPIMIFCMTRKACQTTARMLAKWWSSRNSNERYWRQPQRPIMVEDKDLQQCVPSAVAWHHAGLTIPDRNAIEKGFINGDINVICCTSTLAVGVNLPCHMVILKNTVAYTNGEGIKEYTDLEVMQMLGRAGRPQYDTSGVAVIMTRQEKVRRYERMVSGEQVLESCLHENLIDHLNAEIGLGTITNLASAKKWLTSTFLYVRLKANPNHYRLDDGIGESNIDARLENICCRDLDALREAHLIEGDTRLDSTPYGEAMARYCVRFETAKIFLALPKGALISEILSALAMAQEWQDIRFRGTEKSSYKDLNKMPSIRFPIHVNLDSSAHKVSLIIQSQLGGVNLPLTEKTQSNAFQYTTDTALVFQHLRRLIRCVIDFKATEEDSVSLRNALFMCRSIGARCWDDWSLALKQLDKIGPAGVVKLASIGVNSIEALESTEAHRIETALRRNPPFGMQVIDAARAFPRLRVSVNVVGKPTIKAGKGAKINVDAEIGFLNEKPVSVFKNHPVYLVFLAEVSDGKCVHFGRSSAKKVGKGQRQRFSVELTSPSQMITCYVMCDEIAGTCASVSLKPTIPSIAWPVATTGNAIESKERSPIHAPNTSKRRSSVPSANKRDEPAFRNEFGDDLLDETDLAAVLDSVEEMPFQNIDSFDLKQKNKTAPRGNSIQQHTAGQNAAATEDTESTWEPIQRPDGNWDCNHKCADKDSCRHYCCNHGVTKPPKRPNPRGRPSKNDNHNKQQGKPAPQKGQMTLDLKRPAKRPLPSMDDDMEMLDLTQSVLQPKRKAPKSSEFKQLETLHKSTQGANNLIASRFPSTPHAHLGTQHSNKNLSFMPSNKQQQDESTDYGPDLSDFNFPDNPLETPDRFENDVAMVNGFVGSKPPQTCTADETSASYGFGESDGVLEEAMIGLADSHALRQELAHAGPSNANSTMSAGIEARNGGLSTKPVKTTGLRAPFFEASSDENVGFAHKTKSPSDHEAAFRHDTGSLQPSAKKPRAESIQGSLTTDAPRKVEPATKSEEARSDECTEIDPMILSMFGSYVDFV